MREAIGEARIVLRRAFGVELNAYAAIRLAYDERIHIDSILGAANNSGRRLGRRYLDPGILNSTQRRVPRTIELGRRSTGTGS